MTLNAEPIYLTAGEVLALHGELVGSPTASAELARDWNLLESALHRPRTAAYYEAATLARQAATLLWGIVENHPFHDGNKRTGWVAMRTFLLANGWTIAATEDEKFDLVIGVTQGLEVGEVEGWLGERLAPAPLSPSAR
jgi:death-on-curing protein